MNASPRLCSSCPNEISAKRLKAVPNTALCIDCADANPVAQCREPAVNMRRLAWSGSADSDDSYHVRNRSRAGFRLSTGGLGFAISEARV